MRLRASMSGRQVTSALVWVRAPTFWSVGPHAPSPCSLFRLKARLGSTWRLACQCSNCVQFEEELSPSHCLNRVAGTRQPKTGMLEERAGSRQQPADVAVGHEPNDVGWRRNARFASDRGQFAASRQVAQRAKEGIGRLSR